MSNFKAGLEVHQQLNTDEKLFCRCKSHLTSKKPDLKTIRYFRPTLSETGEIDPTALKAFKRRKKIVYATNTRENCLYELNEAPPYGINKEALQTALFISKMLKATIPDVLPVSRKQYLDGSVPSGFQRTMVVGFDGSLELTSEKHLKINQICLEEDAARKVTEESEERVFKTDRLGIPLIEITTSPQLTTIKEVKDAALRIGALFRSIGKAKRGIGSVRQDLNISIKGGSRVEIKGVQRPEWFKPLIKGEIKRQRKLKKISEELKARNVTENAINAQNMQRVSRIFRDTEAEFIKKAVEKGEELFAICLPGFKGLLDENIQKKRTFGKEFADRVSVTVGLGGILHTDELPAYGITEREKRKLFERINANEEEDTIVIVIGNFIEGKDAIEEVKERAIQSLGGVPRETRKAHEDGTTSFERPLGTAARLYPDTDTPPIRIPSSLVEKAKKKRQKIDYPWERKERYIDQGISERHAEPLALSWKGHVFEKIIELGVDPQLAATILVERFKELEREGYPMEKVKDEQIIEIFERVGSGQIAKEAIPDVLLKLAENPNRDVKDVLNSLEIEKMTKKELEQVIDRLIAENQEYCEEEGMAAFKGLMGDLMQQVKGRIDGAVAAKTLRKRLNSLLEQNEL